MQGGHFNFFSKRRIINMIIAAQIVAAIIDAKAIIIGISSVNFTIDII